MSRKLVIALALVGFSCSAVSMQAQSTDAPPARSAQSGSSAQSSNDPTAAKARKLLDDMIRALGGQAYLTYRNQTSQGRGYSFYHGNPNSAGTIFWKFYEYPDKERTELTKQRDIAYIRNGDKGYEITFKGTAPEEDKTLKDYLRRRQHSLDIVLREWLKDPQTLVLYSGSAIADQRLVEKVTIINKENDEVTIGIDQNTSLPINRVFTYRDKDRYKVQEELVFGNYRTVQGIATPFTLSNKVDGELTSQSFLNDVKYNVDLAPGLFEAKQTYDPQTYKGK